MKKRRFRALASGCLLASLCASPSGAEPNDALLRRALADELERTMQRLALSGQAKPHFASYMVLDGEHWVALATQGAVAFETAAPERSLIVSLRVGTPELDSSNAGFTGGEQSWLFGAAPLEDDYAAVRRELWLGSDAQYKSALESLAYKKNALSARVVERTDAYPDFAPEPRHEVVVAPPPARQAASDHALRTSVERLARLLAAAPKVLDSSASASRSRLRRRLLTSEGSFADETREFAHVALYASAQADDGMELHAHVDFTGSDPSTLPAIDAMQETAKLALARLEALRTAPLADGGTAVILFEGLAAAQLVQGLLAQPLSGTPPMRFVGADTDRSLGSKLGFEVVSPLLDVYDDPTLKTGPGGEPLWGSYAADDEGVPARRVSLIERGVLKTLLMSRSPRKEIRESNGHYRHGRGAGPGNLIVRPHRVLSRARLLALAEREARKRGANTKVYVVQRLAPRHGFAGATPWPGGHQPLSFEDGAFAAEAALVSGGKEQPVRGLMIERIDLRALKDILGAGDRSYVFNHEPTVPTSIVTPSLLLPNVDVKRREADNPKPPSYPAP